MVTIFWLLYIAIPMLAPVLMHYGYQTPADWIYTIYSFNCHQLSYRSYFFFGQDSVYTVDQLRDLVNVHDESFLYWRDFRGNVELGYKMALCERDTAIYAAMALGGMMFGLMHRQLKPLDWRIYIVAFILPILADGGSQLIGLRESNYIFRTITGAWFGLGSVWLAYPYIETAMRELREQAQAQYVRARRLNE